MNSEIINLFRHLVGLLGQGGWPDARPLPTQASTTQKGEGKHASSGIQTHDHSVRAVKTRALYRADTVTGKNEPLCLLQYALQRNDNVTLCFILSKYESTNCKGSPTYCLSKASISIVLLINKSKINHERRSVQS
jgi:hypothetical protein